MLPLRLVAMAAGTACAPRLAVVSPLPLAPSEQLAKRDGHGAGGRKVGAHEVRDEPSHDLLRDAKPQYE